MNPMIPRRLSAYEVFFLLVQQGLASKEAKHGFPGVDVAALWRLYQPEVMGGNTGFMNNVQPNVAAQEYLAYIYEGGAPPFWVLSNQL